uniref:Uncharacterized protein n=1 Tax=Arundo donax TaxID=35708 RepID=A0A0A9GS26_ARUDO
MLFEIVCNIHLMYIYSISVSQSRTDTSPPGNNIRRACLRVPWIHLTHLYSVR